MSVFPNKAWLTYLNDLSYAIISDHTFLEGVVGVGIINNNFRSEWKIIMGLAFCILIVMSYSAHANSINLGYSESKSAAKIHHSASDQIAIHFDPNATALGAGQTVEVKITVENTEITAVDHLNLTIDTIGFSNETAVHNMTTQIGSLPQMSNYSTTVNFSLPPREVIDEEVRASGLDLVFAIDGSGSMGEEIDAVKNQLNSLIDNLTLAFTDVRLGAVVYGWNKYSEYPADDDRNYVALGDDFSAIRSFINALSARGGEEPWGDALWVALNRMEWRPDSRIAKMIVLMGDEDCDPGHVVGVGESGSFYNGSELVAVVDGLKNKGIKIYSVLTENPIGVNVEGQFRWISAYTDGESFSLDEGGLSAEDLPHLINEWALNQTHEMVAEIMAYATWQSAEGIVKETSSSQIIWIDLTPPDIALSTMVPFTTNPTVAMAVFANVKDVSKVTQVIGYWKLPGNLWNTSDLEFMAGTSYKLTLPKLPFGSEVQYYVRASDECGNEGSTAIINATIDYPTLISGSIARIYAQNDTVGYQAHLISEKRYVMWVTALNGTVDAALYSGTNSFVPDLSTTENQTMSLVWTQPENGPNVVRLASEVAGLNETVFLKVALAEIQELNISDSTLPDRQFSMSADQQIHVFEINMTVPPWADDRKLWLHFPLDSALVARMRVYNDDWKLLTNLSLESSYGARFPKNGTYYLRIERAFREGNYSFTDEYAGYDPYRSAIKEDEQGVDEGSYSPEWSFVLAIIFLFALFRRRKRKRWFKKTGSQ
ncbi:MAG: VWA domain-containing protein [Candidatus Heimdallarchaeota archaeon]